MPEWTVGADRNLPILDDDSWDGVAAEAGIFAWAGWDDNPDSGRARRGFLVYDASAPDLKGSYKLPFARVDDGRLKASRAGLRAAASRLPQTEIPADVMERARAVIEHYQGRIEQEFRGLRVFRDAAGRPWWVARSASAFLALDGWFIATAALAADAERQEGRGPLNLWHEDDLVVGECRGAFLAGHILVEVGDFADTPLARAFVPYAEQTDDALGVSIEWETPPEDTDWENWTFHSARIVKRAVAPKDMCADYTSAFAVKREVDRMGLQEWLKEITGFAPSEEDRAVIEAEVLSAEEASEVLEDVIGVPVRTLRRAGAPPGGEEVSEPEALDAPEATEPGPEARAPEAFDVATMLQELGDALSAMLQTKIGELAEQVGKMGATAEETGRAVVDLRTKVEEIEGRLNDQSAMRKAFMEGLTKRASCAPETALDPVKVEDMALANGRVGITRYPWSPQ